MSGVFALVFSWCEVPALITWGVPQGDVAVGRRASVMVCQRG